jgi:hypothetical protein
MRLTLLLLLIPCASMAQGSFGNSGNLRVVGSNSTGSTYPYWGRTTLRVSNSITNIDTLITERNIYSNGANGSDIYGNLLFYTNGYTVMDKNGDILINGDSLSPTPYSLPDLVFGGNNFQQSSFVFRHKQDSNIYSMIHTVKDGIGVAYGPLKVWYSNFKVMEDSSILVINKNSLLLIDTIEFGGIIGCKHANGRDWWIVIKRWNSILHHSFLFTPDSIYKYDNDVIGVPLKYDLARTTFSADGSKFVTYDNISGLRLFSFDRCTGIINFLSYIPDPDNSSLLGVSGNFSPNGAFFYFNNTDKIYRISMSSSMLSSDVELVEMYTPFVETATNGLVKYFSMEVSNDGKLYLGGTGSCRSYCIIDYPDAINISDIGYHHFEFQIPYFNNQTYTNHANYSLGPLPGSPCDTLGLTLDKLQLKAPEINIGPNPNNGHFNVNFTEQKISGVLEVYDLNGQLMHSEYVAPWSNTKQLNLQHQLSNGMYALRLTFGEQTGVVKFVVSNSPLERG